MFDNIVKRAKNRAFTIIELMIVVAIVATLAAIGLLRYFNVVEKARSGEAYAVLSDVAAAESSYFAENNAYTTTWSSLDRYEAAPSSANFTYSLSANCYGRATPVTGTKYYQMSFDGTSNWSGSAPVDLNKCP